MLVCQLDEDLPLPRSELWGVLGLLPLTSEAKQFLPLSVLHFPQTCTVRYVLTFKLLAFGRTAQGNEFKIS